VLTVADVETIAKTPASILAGKPQHHGALTVIPILAPMQTEPEWVNPGRGRQPRARHGGGRRGLRAGRSGWSNSSNSRRGEPWLDAEGSGEIWGSPLTLPSPPMGEREAEEGAGSAAGPCVRAPSWPRRPSSRRQTPSRRRGSPPIIQCPSKPLSPLRWRGFRKTPSPSWREGAGVRLNRGRGKPPRGPR
jgi:hypothetical protein